MPIFKWIRLQKKKRKKEKVKNIKLEYPESQPTFPATEFRNTSDITRVYLLEYHAAAAVIRN